jgi:hypothetical protein
VEIVLQKQCSQVLTRKLKRLDPSRDVSVLVLLQTLPRELRQKIEYPAAKSMVAANSATTDTAMIVS